MCNRSQRTLPCRKVLSHLAYMMIKRLTRETLAITVWSFRGWRHNPPQPSGDWPHCRKCRHRFHPEIKREDFPRSHLYFTIKATLRTEVYELRSSTTTDHQTIICISSWNDINMNLYWGLIWVWSHLLDGPSRKDGQRDAHAQFKKTQHQQETPQSIHQTLNKKILHMAYRQSSSVLWICYRHAYTSALI